MTKYQTETPDSLTLPTGTDLVIYVTPHHLHYFAEGVECPVVKWCTLTKKWVNKEGYYSLCDVANAHTVVWQSEQLEKQRNYEKTHLRRVITKDEKPKSETQPSKAKDASSLCVRASELLAERGKQYDGGNAERSMASTVAAFNAVYGTNLTEQQGWHFMVILKMVRQRQGGHIDSAEDLIAYAALAAETVHTSLV